MNDNSPSAFDARVGRKLKSARRLAGLTQAQLGEKIGVTYQQVQKYETGHNRLSAERISQLMMILRVPLIYFFDDEVLPSDPGPSAATLRLVAGIDALPTDKIRQDIKRLVASINYAWVKRAGA